MKILEPINTDIEVEQVQDRSTLSDLYLRNQEMVDASQAIRNRRIDGIVKKDPLAVRVIFSIPGAISVSALAAISVTMTTLVLAITGFAGEGENVIGVTSKISFICFGIMIAVLMLRSVYNLLSDFCMRADISQGAAMFFMVPALACVAIASILQMGKFGPLLLYAAALFAYNMVVLWGLYVFVHRKLA